MLSTRSLLLILGLFGTVSVGAAQTSPQYTYTLGANAYQGSVIAHSPKVAHFVPSYPVGFELFVNKNTYGHTYWEQRYKCPDLGLALTYTDYQNPKLGKSIGATLYMDIPVVRFRRSRLTFGLGTGLGYHTNSYRPPLETGNVMLGTPITLSMRSQLSYACQLSSRWRAVFSAKLIHYSNAAYSRPNRGLNMPIFSAGIARVIGREIPDYVAPSEVPRLRTYQRWSYYVGVSVGAKTIRTYSERQRSINVHVYSTRRFSEISGLVMGLDAFLDNATRQYIRQQHQGDWPDHRRLGLVVGHELSYNRLSLLTQVGVYLYRPYKDLYKPVYHRVGLRYAFTQHMMGSFMLKAHGGRAEMLELGLGARF